MEELFAHLMITAVIAILAVVAMEFLNFLLRRRAIKSGHLDEIHLRLLTSKVGKFSALKWGILFLSGGLGLVVIGFMPQDAEKSPVPWGIEVIFIGIGLLVYYLLIKKEES
ncbi:MAG: DUF6249 domain-containing protein [Chitinophagaceae bacterium]